MYMMRLEESLLVLIILPPHFRVPRHVNWCCRVIRVATAWYKCVQHITKRRVVRSAPVFCKLRRIIHRGMVVDPTVEPFVNAGSGGSHVVRVDFTWLERGLWLRAVSMCLHTTHERQQGDDGR